MEGILFALLAAGISGISIFYNKQIVVAGIDPLVFNIIKNGGVAIILSLLLISTNKIPHLRKLTRVQWRNVLLIGAIGGSIPFLLFFEGLRMVAATNANLIQKTLFLWVALLALPFLKEKLKLWQIVGYTFIVWSNFFLGGLSGFTGSKGEFFILSATILWSVENIIAKIALKNTDATLVSWGRMTIGTAILIGIAFFEGKMGNIVKVPPTLFLPVTGSILLLTGYVTSWYKALSKAPATVVTALLVLATPITNILTAVFQTHSLPQPQLISAVVTLLGVLLIGYFGRKRTIVLTPSV